MACTASLNPVGVVIVVHVRVHARCMSWEVLDTDSNYIYEPACHNRVPFLPALPPPPHPSLPVAFIGHDPQLFGAVAKLKATYRHSLTHVPLLSIACPSLAIGRKESTYCSVLGC